MPVFEDYRAYRFGRYFTANFLSSHLRPFEAVPIGGHREARERARAGNLDLVARAQQGRHAEWNSIIYDLDLAGKVRQVLRLMHEVERRNADGSYRDAVGLATSDPYHIHTTTFGSRQSFNYRRFHYAVIAIEGGRMIINHYAGAADD